MNLSVTVNRLTREVLLLSVLILSFKTQEVKAQETFNDAMSWLSFDIQENIHEKLSAKLLTRCRLGENFTQINSWYSDLGVQYEFSKHFNATINYVLTPSRMSNLKFRSFHQYYGSINFRENLMKHLSFGDRIIIQRTSSGAILDSGDPSKNSIDLRNKTDFKKRINKHYDVFVADELLWTLSKQPIEIHRNRFYAGFSRVINKRIDLDFYFVLQSSYHSSSQNYRYYIYGVDFNYKLKRLKWFDKKNADFSLPDYE